MNPEQLKAAFEEFKAAQLQANEAVKAMVKEQAQGTQESIKASAAKAEEAAKKVQALADRLVEMEQKLVAGVQSGKQAPKSLGQLVVESDEFKQYASGQTSKMMFKSKQGFDVMANTITGQSGSPAANNDTITPAQRIPGIIPGAFRRLRVRDIIPQGVSTSNSIEATRELLFTNAAAETAEGAAKPESTLTFELYSTPVVTIAHWIKASKQILEDAPALASYIETRLRYGVELREEQQLIAGAGTGQNLTGMTISPNFTAFTPTTGDNALDSINRAKYLVEAADYAPTAIILNPADWGTIERTKVGTADDRYVVGDPRSALGPFLWGLPVIVTNSMTSGKLLVAAFDIAFMLWNRQEAVVQMFEQDDTNVQKNLITIRAEKRCALAGYRPASVYYGSLTI